MLLKSPFFHVMKSTFDVNLISKLNGENKNLFREAVLCTTKIKKLGWGFGFPRENTVKAVKELFKIKGQDSGKKDMQLCEQEEKCVCSYYS